MCADVAGFVLAYHGLWIEVTPETEFPLSTAYIVADLLYEQNIHSRSSQERGGQIVTLQKGR